MSELLKALRALVDGSGVRPPPLEGRDELLARRLIQGETNKRIARHLGVTEHAIRNRLSGLYARYGCHSRAELVHFLLEHRLVSLESGET